MIKFLFLLAFISPIYCEVSQFIVGGRDAAPGQFPHMVSLRAAATPQSHGCGGGILNTRWILTAAHCLILRRPGNIIAVVGLVRLSEGTRYNISQVVQHPRYIPNIPPIYTSNWHDIGLVKTTLPIIFNEFTQPIPLGRRVISGGRNTRAIMAGFGAYDPSIDVNTNLGNITMSEHLQYIETTIITQSSCTLRASLFIILNPRYPIRPIIHPTSHICTLSGEGIGLCFGDSGSILMMDGQAVGVVASGVRVCAQDHRAPDIYARVSTYVNWIERHIRDLS